MTRTVKLSVTGRVQGVGYRAFVATQANQLGLAGWVRNRIDGSVEVVVHGVAEKIDRLVETCREGPQAAQVNTLHVVDAAEDAMDLRRSGEKFSMLPTM